MLLDSMLFTGAREQYSGVCQFGVGAPKRSLGSMCGMGKSSPLCRLWPIDRPTKCQISGFRESLMVFAGYNSGCALQNVSRLPFLYMHPNDENIW